MAKKAFSTALSGALALGSFLCLGMGMDMGSSWAPQQSHDCCPSQAPEKSDSNCCLLLPGAVPAPVVLPVPVQVTFALPAAPAALALSVDSRSVFVRGPPGDSSPGYAAPSAPRAPPVA